MPNTRFPYVHGNLNDANDTTQTGLSEPITGLELPSGCVLGQYADWTASEAAAYSNPAVGILSTGRYQRVYLDPGAATLKQGQLLFWVLNGTYKHQVTNVEPANVSRIAGIYLNTASAGAFPVDPGKYFWMQAFGVGGTGSVLMRTNLTGLPSIGCAIYAAAAGAGADNATCDVLDAGGNPTFTQSGNLLNRYIGVALALSAGGALLQVDLAAGRMMVN